MSTIKVSDLAPATNLAGADIFYVVNGGNPRKMSLDSLILYIKTNIALALSVNSVLAINNAITLSKYDIGLGNVPNVVPVVSINGLSNAVNLSAADTTLLMTTAGQAVSFAVNPNFTLDWSKLTGNFSSQSALASALASVGVQQAPRATSLNDIVANDFLRQWVDVDVTTATQMTLPGNMNAPIGALIEFRQKGAGTVTAVGDAISTV